MSGLRHYDLIIVGASFAGLACARTAAMRGLKVAVVERKRDPGDQVRTTGIFVKEAAEDTDVPAELTRRIRGVRLYAPNGSHSDHWAPGYYFLATDTPGLLRWMAQEAWRAGATLQFGARFGGASQDARGVYVPELASSALPSSPAKSCPMTIRYSATATIRPTSTWCTPAAAAPRAAAAACSSPPRNRARPPESRAVARKSGAR